MNEAATQITEAPVRRRRRPEAPKLTAKQKAAQEAKGKKETAAKKKLAAQEAKKAATAKKAADVVAAKAKKTADAEKKLSPLAKEINVRLEKAEKIEAGANDHRLAAILILAEAEKVCKASGIKFNAWCEANVHWKPETIRKMLPVAKASDPMKALVDLREGNKNRNKKSRDKKKAASVSRDTTKPVDVIQALRPEDQLKTVQKIAGDLGMAVVSETDAAKIDKAADAAAFDGIEAMKRGFEEMKAADKMTFLHWAASSVGATVTLPDFDGTAEE